jgi:hypothetical protein
MENEMWVGWRAAWARVGWAAVLAPAPGLAACIPDPLSLAAAGADAAADGTPAGDGAGDDAESSADATSTGDGESGSGCTCVDPAPSGWSFVAFESSARTACPGGWSGPTDVLVDPTGVGPASCSCACSATADPPTCTKGMLGLVGGNSPSCPVTGNPVSANGGACTPSNVGLPYPYLGVVPPAASGGSCTPSVTATPPPPGGTSGRTCAASAPPPQGTCAASQVCAPDAPSPYAVCIAQAGAVPCPSQYPHTHTTGTSITTGGCGACTCGTPTATCTGGTFSAYFNSSCGNLLLSVPADGQCHATSSGNASSYRFTVTPTNVACPVAQAPQPTGSGALQGTVTVCCP